MIPITGSEWLRRGGGGTAVTDDFAAADAVLLDGATAARQGGALRLATNHLAEHAAAKGARIGGHLVHGHHLPVAVEAPVNEAKVCAQMHHHPPKTCYNKQENKETNTKKKRSCAEPAEKGD